MIKIEKILVPTDLSDYAVHALHYARELAATYGARLYLLHVVDTHWVGPPWAAEFPGQVQDYMQQFRQNGKDGLNALVKEIKGIEAEAVVEMGTPHVEIVRFAREQHIDLIVLATHGRRGLSHALIGSVAEKVVQMAPCPVLSVKHPEHEFVVP